MVQPNKDRTAIIRELNDALRREHKGGRVFMSAGIAELGSENVRQIVAAVAQFDEFEPDNDPHGEHDCGTVAVNGNSILWKIDYYDLALEMHPPDAADAAVTTRVLTIMLADEY